MDNLPKNPPRLIREICLTEQNNVLKHYQETGNLYSIRQTNLYNKKDYIELLYYDIESNNVQTIIINNK